MQIITLCTSNKTESELNATKQYSIHAVSEQQAMLQLLTMQEVELSYMMP